ARREQRFGVLGAPDTAGDRLAYLRQAEVLDRQPNLERVRRAGELFAVVGEVNILVARADVGEIFRVDTERLLELAWFTRKEAAALERNEQPFVRVERYGVGAAEPVEHWRSLFRERGEAGVRRVDMHPELFAGAEIGDGVQRIHGAGVRRARAGHDEEGDT